MELLEEKNKSKRKDKRFKVEKKSTKGITLIALVITIIVLIILAAVSINLTLGENGIIKRAQLAASENNKAKLEEQLKIFQVNSYMNNEEFKDILIENNMIDEEELENNAIVKIADNENFLAINKSEGLEEISTSIKNGDDYEGKVIYLLEDITFDNTFNIETGELLTGEAFEPIGDSNSKFEDELLEGSIKKEFNGTFNGLNHEIKNLYINENSEGNYCAGLFGYVGEKGKVENVIISDSYISGYFETGSIAGRNKGSIVNCVNKGVINANKLTGGIVGRNCAEIKGCINYGDIYATSMQAGGIVANCDFGENIVISDCKNYGNILSTSNTIGGIVGGAYNGSATNLNVNVTIINCENYGNIGENKTNYNYIGGIAGHSRGVVKNCINKGIIRGNQEIGGIVGTTSFYNSESTLIENCYNYNSVVGNYVGVGGICGSNAGRNNFKMW